MCGIAGLFNVNLSTDEIWTVIRRMTVAIVHRGPDDDGYFVSAPVALGMRRLSIIDLESGKQPIHNEDSTIQVVFNGEIYNYPELKISLQSLGHVFYTQSDTEVIVHAYEEYGEVFLNKLRGMFSLALWDVQRQIYLLAIDRMGIKPLYYAINEQGLVFGSELSCLLTSGQIARDMDYNALSQYFTFGYIPGPYTIFKKVNKLLPGHYLRWTPSGKISIEPYWDFSKDSIRFDRPLAQTRKELRETVKEAVRSHLISDVPLGAFLSGGIDSSIVVALMSEINPGAVKTFSIGFAEREFNELDKARLVAKRFHTEHHELIVEPDAVDILPKIVRHFGEPFADSSALPTYYVSKMARQYVKVVLSGDGGDELFLGYTIFRGLEFARYAQRFPAPIRRALVATAVSLPGIGKSAWKDKVMHFKKQVRDSMLPPREAFYRKMTAGGLDVISPLLSSDVRNHFVGQNPYWEFDEYLDDWADARAHPLEQFVYAGLKIPLAWDMLVKVDRMSMANSLEVRVPFLDHVLAEFVSTIPIEQRFPQWRLKGLLRDTMEDLLPPEILNQPKHGFTIPLAAWFRDDLTGFAADVLLSQEARQSGFLDGAAIEKLLFNHQQGAHNLGTEIWSLLLFELWRQQVMP